MQTKTSLGIHYTHTSRLPHIFIIISDHWMHSQCFSFHININNPNVCSGKPICEALKTTSRAIYLLKIKLGSNTIIIVTILITSKIKNYTSFKDRSK